MKCDTCLHRKMCHYLAKVNQRGCDFYEKEKTGHWEKSRYRRVDQTGETYDDGAALVCSECRNAFKSELLWKRNYCPNCGADMRE